MTEYPQEAPDAGPYEVPPPPGEGVPYETVAAPPAGFPAVPQPSFAPPVPQPQFLGYGADGQPVYGYPARAPMNPMLKTAMMVGAGILGTMLLQAVRAKS